IKRVITTAAAYAQSVYAADLDGDGDLDVLSASRNVIAWYENDGSDAPVFAERVITTAADSAQSVYAADLDGDGDLEVLSASLDNTIAWYRTTQRLYWAAENSTLVVDEGAGDDDDNVLSYAVSHGSDAAFFS